MVDNDQFSIDMKVAYELGYNSEKKGLKGKIKSQKGLYIPKELYDLKGYRWSYGLQKMLLLKFLEGKKDYIETMQDVLGIGSM